MSKKGKKKQNMEQDSLWEKKEREAQKKMEVIKQNVEQDDGEQEVVYQKEFEFNFQNEKEFIEKQQQIERKQEQRKRLLEQIKRQEEQLQKEQKPLPSDADIAAKADRKEKQRKKKEKKQKLKEQRKEAEKLLQTFDNEKKLQEEKIMKVVEAEYKKRKQSESKDGWRIVLALLIFVVAAGYLQYKSEVHQRYESFRVGGQEDLYGILEADSGLSDQQLKQKYKKLAIKYHPDKNKDCSDCKERFAQILKAWQILGSPQKRKAYDQNNGIITKIKSKSVTLTPANYYQLVENSKDLWIVQVYDSTSQYCHHYAQFWEEVVLHYSQFVRFGRIDLWSQDDMREFIPYSFTIFPSIYSVRKDKSTDLYGLDTRRPIDSLKQFIEKQISKQYIEMKIRSSAINQILLKNDKEKVVVVTGKPFSYQLKSILSRYSDYVDAYHLEDRDSTFQSSDIRVYYNGSEFDKYTLKTPQNYILFLNQLPKYLTQHVSQCELIKICEDQPCIVLANETTPVKGKFKYPQLILKDDVAFNQKINFIKSKLHLNQNFEYVIYSNGKVEFANVEDISLIDVEDGEIVELGCVPGFRIPYWSLTKLAILGLLIIYVSNRKVRIALGLLGAYMIYGMFV